MTPDPHGRLYRPPGSLGSPDAIVAAASGAGGQRPVREGLALGGRLLPLVLVRVILPASVVLLALWNGLPGLSTAPVRPLSVLVFLGVGGIVFTGAVACISWMTRDAIRGPDTSLAVLARRWIPWLATYCIVVTLAGLASVFLLVPGFLVSIRLFWADEYVLGHGLGPIAAIRASWRATRGRFWQITWLQLRIQLAFLPLGLAGGVLGMWLPAAEGNVASVGPLLWGVAVGGLCVYALVHAIELTYFYGAGAERLADGIAGAPSTRGSSRVPALRVLNLIGLTFLHAGLLLAWLPRTPTPFWIDWTAEVLLWLVVPTVLVQAAFVFRRSDASTATLLGVAVYTLALLLPVTVVRHAPPLSSALLW